MHPDLLPVSVFPFECANNLNGIVFFLIRELLKMGKMYSKEFFLNYQKGSNYNASEELLLLNAKPFSKASSGRYSTHSQ